MSKGKRLYDSENNLYIVVEIIDQVTILYNHGPKEFIVTRPLRLDSNDLVILEGPGVWWCWTYGGALRLIDYIKYNG